MKYKIPLPKLISLAESKWLTDKERQVLDLYYIRGWHIEDVAAEMDVCRSTVNNYLKAIREKATVITGK